MIKGGPTIINDGLVLCLDAHDAKSYAGEPTTNFFYGGTPRIDSSYSSYVYNSDSSWAANHPDAITVYNTDGSNISSYVNTGANSGNWNVISHAHWVYDNELKKPVVRMHSIPGYESQWRALYSGLGHNLSELGLTAGDKFTISWLQKAYVAGVYARAGIYMSNTGGSNGFHAGQASSSDVGQLSSELGKWAHKSKTFTVPSGMNETGYDVGLYMYGHYSPTNNNTIYISDVQIEKGDYATPIVQGVSSSNSGYWGTRSATNGWVDRSGNSNSGTLTNMIGTEVTHYRDGQVIMPVANSYLEFDGTNDIVTISSPSFTTINTHSVCAWVNTDDVTGWRTIIDFDNDEWLLALNNKNFTTYDPTFYSGYYLTAGKWHHVCRTHESGGPVYLYLDGALVYTSTNVSVSKTFSKINIGAGLSVGSSTPNELWNGKIAQVQMYSRKLSTAEVLSNYNTTKSRFS